MKRYEWLLFDADGTLFDYDTAEGVALREVFRLHDLEFEPGHLTTYRQINHAAWQALEKGELTLSGLKVRRFELFLNALEISHSPKTFSDAYLECLAARAELVEDAAEMLQALQGKYRMAILTNGLTTVQRGRLARSNIHHHFADVIISEEIGVAKPSREYFDVVWQRLGHPPRHEALMIGDGWASDIVGAVQYDVDACWFNPARKPRPVGHEIIREIASLRELIGWLG